MMDSYLASFTELSQSLGHGLDWRASKLERFGAELNFAHRLRRAHPDQSADWEERIVEAAAIVTAGLREPSVDIDALIARGETTMAPISAAAKTYTLLCVSHAHIDMNWMWSYPETVAVANDTFRTVLALMDEFPGFIFSQDQASTYHLIERYNPALFEAIRQRVQEGRWEVTGSHWVEADKNMSSGESLSRHLLYTREYFAERFGLKPEDICVDFEPDTFGHPVTVPSILARGGVRYYYHCRGSNGPHFSWWVGPDGSRVLAFNDVKWYQGPILPTVADPLTEFTLSTGLKAMPKFYGVGDHGGGPTRRDLQRIIEMDTWPVFPRLRFARMHEVFAEAEAKEGIPEVSTERNFIFAGCYTSQARQKWANRHGENLLYTAEAAALAGERLAGVPYPQEGLDEAWREVLFEQFHDILPGSGVRETRHYAMGKAQEVQAAAGMARTNALRALAERIDTQSLLAGLRETAGRAGKDRADAALALGAGVGFGSGVGGESATSQARSSDRAFLIFNPLPHPRTEVIEATLWDATLDLDQLVVTSDGAAPAPVQVLDQGKYWAHDYVTVAFPVQVPALGYRAVCVSDRLAEMGLLADEVNDPWDDPNTWRRVKPLDNTLDNGLLRVQIDPASGGLVSLVDQRTGREWVPEGKQAGILEYCIEQNIGMTAWTIGPFLTRESLLDGGKLKRVHRGPYVQTFRSTRTVSNTAIELEITLRQGSPQVEYRLRVDWREMGDIEDGTPNLRVRFPLAVEDPAPRYEIPFGSMRRDLFDGEEVCAQRWADLSEADGQGVALVNSSKYGFSLEGDTLTMTLLRASIDPDPLPDIGEHVIEYALAPHGEGWAISDSVQAGEEINIALVVTSCGFQKGSLPLVQSLVSVEPSNVRLAALKRSQVGEALVARLVEVDGQAVDARIVLAGGLVQGATRAIEVDTLERPLETNGASMADNVVTLTVPAFGISAVRIE